MITKIASYRGGQVVYEFDNGNIISIVWSWGSYSDNYSKRPSDYTKDTDAWESTTVEIYSMGEDNNNFTKFLNKFYGGNPAGHVDVKHLPTILKRADKKIK